jgi:hypothetical protein
LGIFFSGTVKTDDTYAVGFFVGSWVFFFSGTVKTDDTYAVGFFMGA